MSTTYPATKTNTQNPLIKTDDTLERIYRAGLKLLVPLTLLETYAVTVNEAVKLVKADEGLILLEENDILKTVYGSTKEAASFKSRKRGLSYKAYKNNEAFVAHKRDFETFTSDISKKGINSIIFIPLSYKNKTIGVLLVRLCEVSMYFSQKELDVLKLYGSMASLAITRAQLYNETKEALELRDLFISLAAHELRTPLTSINGYIQLLHARLTKKNTTEGKWITELQKESERLTKLVTELLEVNRIKSGTFHYVFEKCNLDKIITSAITLTNISHPQRLIEYKSTLSKKQNNIVADQKKILQVLINIINNSIKFSPEDSVIKITVKYKSPFIILRVTDRGKGIFIEDVEKIFKGFYKGKNNHGQGLGVGLYLSKEIITSHHGTISVQSKVNKGTTVEVKLPRVTV